MIVSEITLFNTLKSKLGEQEAQTVVEGIKTAVAEEFNSLRNQLALKEDLANTKTEILRWTFSFVFGALLLNILAIIGAVIAVAPILSGINTKFINNQARPFYSLLSSSFS